MSSELDFCDLSCGPVVIADTSSDTSSENYSYKEDRKECEKCLALRSGKFLGDLKNDRVLIGTAALVDCERLLLLSTYKHNCSAQINRTANCSAKLKVINIHLPLIRRKLANRFQERFVCIVESDLQIFATQARKTEDGDLHINFEDCFTLRNLQPDFLMKISIYCMKVKKSNGFVGIVKKCIKKVGQYVRQQKRQMACDYPSFKCVGNVHLRIDDVTSGTATWRLENVSVASSLAGIVGLSSIPYLSIKEKYSGFLTIGQKSAPGYISWTRRWCVLDGIEFKCWSDPDDAQPAEICLNLRYSPSPEVGHAPRNLCAKRNTLLLEIVQQFTCSLNFFLAADSSSDCQIWRAKLNTVLTLLNKWKALVKINEALSDTILE